jgi:hypothetical protein
LSELDTMLPWEREIYVALLMKHLKEEEQKAKNRKNNGY